MTDGQSLLVPHRTLVEVKNNEDDDDQKEQQKNERDNFRNPPKDFNREPNRHGNYFEQGFHILFPKLRIRSNLIYELSGKKFSLRRSAVRCYRFLAGNFQVIFFVSYINEEEFFTIHSPRMNILVLNCGSSSAKFQIIQTDKNLIDQNADKRLASGIIERIGSQALITFEAAGKPKTKRAKPLRDHHVALTEILQWVVSPEAGIDGISSLADIAAVGHRVVHGGEKFTMSVIIDEKVIDQIEDTIELAPLHNPANLKGISAARALLGTGVPQVAVFDTTFHSTMPQASYLYAIPYQMYRRHRIR